MIGIKVLKPRTGLMPRSYRRISTALGLALAIALNRASKFKFNVKEACAWRGTPDTVYIKCDPINIELGRHVDMDLAGKIAEEFGRKRWDGVTVTLNGELGKAKLEVDIDIYANEYVPLRAGITNERLEVLAEPRGYIDDEVIDNFYELFDLEYDNMRAVIEELTAEMYFVELKVATYTGVRTYKLSEATARVVALRNYSFTPEDTIPLWYRPWTRQIARTLYTLTPPGLGRLVGHYGMRSIVNDIAPELRRYLERYYEVIERPSEKAIQLIPKATSPSTQNHRKAITELREILKEAMKTTAGEKARKIIQEKGYIDWQDLIETLEEELRQRLT
jgi:hypothetical protein